MAICCSMCICYALLLHQKEIRYAHLASHAGHSFTQDSVAARARIACVDTISKDQECSIARLPP